MEKMTIHRGLSELKLIDAKIQKYAGLLVSANIYQKDKKINGHIELEDFKKEAESNYDAVMAQIARKGKIKSAIVNANSTTKVKVGSREMTIADAINEKAVIQFKRLLIDRLQKGHQSAVAALNKNNDAVNQNVLRLLEVTLGKEAQTKTAEAEGLRKTYLENNEFHLYDPIEALKKAEALEKEIQEFEAEVDAALSEINSTTFIEF